VTKVRNDRLPVVMVSVVQPMRAPSTAALITAPPHMESSALAFTGACVRLTSKSASTIVHRRLVLRFEGNRHDDCFLEVQVPDGSSSKRTERLSDPQCLFGVHVSIALGEILFQFQSKRDLALRFPTAAHQDVRQSSATTAVESSVSDLVRVLDAVQSRLGRTAILTLHDVDDVVGSPWSLTSPAKLKEAFAGHGAPITEHTNADRARLPDHSGARSPPKQIGDDAPNAVHASSSAQVSTSSSSTVPHNELHRRRVSFMDPLGRGMASLTALQRISPEAAASVSPLSEGFHLMNLNEMTLDDGNATQTSHGAALSPTTNGAPRTQRRGAYFDEDDDLLSVYLKAESFLLDMEDAKVQADVAWASHQTQKSVRDEQLERRRLRRKALQDEAIHIRLEEILVKVCHKQRQRFEQRQQRKREREVLKALQLERMYKRPDEVFLTCAGADSCYTISMPPSHQSGSRNVIENTPNQLKMGPWSASGIDDDDLYDIVSPSFVSQTDKGSTHASMQAGVPNKGLFVFQQSDVAFGELGFRDFDTPVGRALWSTSSINNQEGGRRHRAWEDTASSQAALSPCRYAPRQAILVGSNGRLTTLGQPLFRRYGSNISDLL
jgi:hypothetical protein